MSDRLDKSLEEIISTQRRAPGARGGRGARATRGPRRSTASNRPTAPTPAGGIKKNLRPAKGAVKQIPTGPSGGTGEGKIIVSGLPKDVSEVMIKDFFIAQVGPVKRVELSYGPGGVSRGVVNITFHRYESATKAVAECNGIPVDNRPIKVELILDAKNAKAIPPPKGLSERVTQPKSQIKSQPKSAAETKTPAGTRGGKDARGRGRGGKARNARPAKKTAEELDSEMMDYFGGSGAAPAEGANGAAPATTAATGDATMDDEIL